MVPDPRSTTAPPSRAGVQEEDPDERPTVVPEFDPEAFARDSEIKQRAASAVGSEPTIDHARQLHVDGEHEQALFLLRRLLELAPLHPEATKLSNDCRQALETECLTALGSASTVFVVAVSTSELKGSDIDNVSGFLLSVIDGATDVDAILDISGLPRLLALRHMRALLERGLIAVAGGSRSSR